MAFDWDKTQLPKNLQSINKIYNSISFLQTNLFMTIMNEFVWLIVYYWYFYYYLNIPMNLLLGDTIPECKTSSLVIQIIIIVLSLAACIATIVLIFYHKLTKDPFIFLIMAIQISFTFLSMIDLITKAYSTSFVKKWCQAVTPFAFATILISFIYIELFCYMIYKTIKKQLHGTINKNIKIICLIIAIGAVLINFIGYQYFDVGICGNCTFMATESKSFLEIVMIGVFYIDYFLPILLMFFIGYRLRKLHRYYVNEQLDQRQLTIVKKIGYPLINFVFLIINNVISIPRVSKELYQSIPQELYIFLYEILYFVPVINFVIYIRFVQLFGLYQKQDQMPSYNLCKCFCPQNQIQKDVMIYSDFSSSQRFRY